MKRKLQMLVLVAAVAVSSVCMAQTAPKNLIEMIQEAQAAREAEQAQPVCLPQKDVEAASRTIVRQIFEILVLKSERADLQQKLDALAPK